MKFNSLSLSSLVLIGLIVCSSCKKSDETIVKTLEENPSPRQKFPRLTNLTIEESDSLKSLLTGGQAQYKSLIDYASQLEKLHKLNDTKTSHFKFKSSTLNTTSNNSEPFDESESTTSSTIPSVYYEPLYADFDGYDFEIVDGFYGPELMDAPKFTMKHTAGGTLPGRNTVVNIEVPIEYKFKFNTLPPYQAYYFIDAHNYNSIKKPKMYLSGVMGQLTTEYEQLSWNYYGTVGQYHGTASIKIRENRKLAYTSTGTTTIEMMTAQVGGTNSYGNTISLVRDIQGFFSYNSDFIFYGGNTGYHGQLGNYLVNGLGMGIYQLSKPIIGTASEEITFTGINRN